MNILNLPIQLVLPLCCAFSAFAQSPDYPLSVYGFNERFLEHLIKEKIDSVRAGKGLKPLYNDSILYVAAKFHAKYLFEKKELSHDEPENPLTATPQKRAEYFGAVNYLVGENVAYTAVNRPMQSKTRKGYTNVTYNQTAFDLVDGWVHSPPHYRNILTGEYNATGVAIWPDNETGRVYAVQKFATIRFKYDFSENKQFFSYSNYVPEPVVKSFEGIERQLHNGRHVHKLKNPRKAKDCSRCFDSLHTPHATSSIAFRNGKVYFSTYDVEWMYNILKYKRDGLAIEVNRYFPYDCGNPAYYSAPSRRNQQCVFSGKVLKPYYRKKAISGFRAGRKLKTIKQKIENGKIEKYEISLGKIPRDLLTEFFELNLVIIQKKRVCRVMKFTDFCGDTMLKRNYLPMYADSVVTGNEIAPYRKNVRFVIPFEKGKNTFRQSDLKPVTDSLLSESFIADTIIINAFSSVEGSEAANRSLQEQRALALAKALTATQQVQAVTSINTQENWELFTRQIQKNKSLARFAGKTKEEIKKELNDSTLQAKAEPWLKEQRSALVTVKATILLNKNTLGKYLLSKIVRQKRNLDSLSYGPLTHPAIPAHIDTLIGYLATSYRYIRTGLLQPGYLKNFRIGKQPYLDRLNDALVKYETVLPQGRDSLQRIRAIYDDIVNLYNHDVRSFFIIYNMINIIEQYDMQLGVSVSPEEQEKYLSELTLFATDSLQKESVQKLEVNLWFRVCKLPWNRIHPTERPLYERCMEKIHSYYMRQTLRMEACNKLAAFYIYHLRFDWARDLLEPYFTNRTNNPVGLSLLSKIYYQNYEETGSTDYSDFLRQVHAIIGTENWCPMFVGPCNISFQVLDDPAFRSFYCEKCSSYLNYAKRAQ